MIVGRKMLVCAIVGAALGLFQPIYVLWAGSVAAHMPVQAEVTAYATYKILKEPTNVRVRAGDVKKGFVEIMPGTMVNVSTNSTEGVLIVVSERGGTYFSSVTVFFGDGQQVTLTPGSIGEIPVFASKNNKNKIRLSYRFDLLPGLPPGEYPWTISLHVQPM